MFPFLHGCRLLRLTILAMLGCMVVFSSSCHADDDPISLFPLDQYDQTVAAWIAPTQSDYDKVLLSPAVQQARLDGFLNHLFGTTSPWNPDYIHKVLRHTPPDDLKTVEIGLLHYFSNEHKSPKSIGYGENFRPLSTAWLQAIETNIHLAQFDSLTYQPEQRGIAVDNLHARLLPTDDVHFYHHKLAGQGYPFDNLQISSLWVGTPVYILGESSDHAWNLVLTPDYIAWVKSSGIAKVSPNFVENMGNRCESTSRCHHSHTNNGA